MRHRPELDGVRGLAILLVLGQHAGQLLPGGHVGVVLFFVLSGYLITSLVAAEHDRTGSVSLRRFYWRRAGRLGPALLLALSALVVLVHFGLGVAFDATAGLDIVIALLYVTNVAVLAPGDYFQLTGWAWSLALEEQFYLTWAPLLRGLLARGLDRRRVARWLLVVAAGSWLARLATVGMSYKVGYFAPLTRVDAIALGCALALRPVRVSRRIGYTGAAALVALAWFADIYAHKTFTLAVGLGLAALASCLAVASADRLRFLSWRPLVWLGGISYALYLWNSMLAEVWNARVGHFPASPGEVAAWLTLSLVAAWASTRWLEQPIRRWAKSRQDTTAIDRKAVVAEAATAGG